MKCPSCEAEVREVYRARSVKLEWDGKKWVETDVFSDQLGCPSCYEELSEEDLKAAGMPLEEKEDRLVKVKVWAYGTEYQADSILRAMTEEEISEAFAVIAQDLLQEGREGLEAVEQHGRV